MPFLLGFTQMIKGDGVMLCMICDDKKNELETMKKNGFGTTPRSVRSFTLKFNAFPLLLICWRKWTEAEFPILHCLIFVCQAFSAPKSRGKSGVKAGILPISFF